VTPDLLEARVYISIFQAADPALLRDYNPNDLLFLAYDTYAINRALYVYRTAEANFREDPDNYVFKIANTIVVRKDSHVLRKDLIERLTDSFSKLPRGQAYENQSSAYMGPILHAANRILRDFVRLPPEQLLVGEFLQSIRQIPNLLTENPYNPKEHDVSKFVDFEENPQYYRNKWIIYFINEMCNSGNDHLNLFNHMKLFILLFRYLTMLPTVNIDRDLIVSIRIITPEALALEEELIDENYRCDLLRVRENQLPRIIRVARVEAQQQIQETNDEDQGIIDAAAAAAARPTNRRRGSRTVAAAEADVVAQPPLRPVRARRQIIPADILAAALGANEDEDDLPLAALPRPALPRPALHQSALHQSALHQPALHQPALHQPAEEEPAQPSARRKTGRNTRTATKHEQGGGVKKPNSHTRKNKYKYPNKVKVKKSNKSKKQKMKSKYKKTKKNVSFKRRRQRKSHK
jgi:hypothetical protein